MGLSKKAKMCPRCASKDILLQYSIDDGVDLYACADCDHEFEVGVPGSRHRTRRPYNVDYSDYDISPDEWDILSLKPPLLLDDDQWDSRLD